MKSKRHHCIVSGLDSMEIFGCQERQRQKDLLSVTSRRKRRGRLREIDVVTPPLVPFLYPDRILRSRRRSGVGPYASVAKGPRVPRDQWPDVAARADRERLWSVARDLGVSDETVRSICQRLKHKAEMG